MNAILRSVAVEKAWVLFKTTREYHEQILSLMANGMSHDDAEAVLKSKVSIECMQGIEQKEHNKELLRQEKMIKKFTGLEGKRQQGFYDEYHAEEFYNMCHNPELEEAEK